MEILVPDTLFVLGGTVPNDGRISWVRGGAGGHIPLNCYLLKQGGHGWLIDTSLPVVEDAVVLQARSFAELDEVDLILTRCVEFDSVGNAEPLLHVLPINVAYADFEPTEWMFFRAPWAPPAREVTPRLLPQNAPLEPSHGREIFVLHTRFRLLATAWLYDAGTRTLFSSDAFTHVLSEEQGQRIVTADTDTTSAEDVHEHLMTKFDWLSGAETGPLRAYLDGFRERWPIEIIAPAYGCVIVGAELVDRHFEMAAGALVRARGCFRGRVRVRRRVTLPALPARQGWALATAAAGGVRPPDVAGGGRAGARSADRAARPSGRRRPRADLLRLRRPVHRDGGARLRYRFHQASVRLGLLPRRFLPRLQGSAERFRHGATDRGDLHDGAPLALPGEAPIRGCAGLGKPAVAYSTGDWAFVGILLTIVLTGFLLEGVRIAMDHPGYSGAQFGGWVVAQALSGIGNPALAALRHGLWWFHGLLAISFVASIPYTKGAHMLGGWVSLALREPDAKVRLPVIEATAPTWPATRRRPTSARSI